VSVRMALPCKTFVYGAPSVTSSATLRTCGRSWNAGKNN
jgi:hypothetical protein